MVELIGNTPIIELKTKSHHRLLAKCEFLNPTGSIKDRVAKYIIEHLKNNNSLKPQQAIIEASSGNMGTSLAAMGHHYGHPVYITCPQKTGPIKRKMITDFGANLTVCSSAASHNEDSHYVNQAKKISIEKNGVLINQYDSPLNTECHYETTGQEIVQYLVDHNIQIDYFITVGGSGGTITGCAKKIKEHFPNTQVIMPDPYGSVYYDIYHTGKVNHNNIHEYIVEGPGNATPCDAMNLTYIDDVVRFNDRNAIKGCLDLAKEHGIYAGHSSGANYHIANQIIESIQTTDTKTILILLLDSGMKYNLDVLEATI